MKKKMSGRRTYKDMGRNLVRFVKEKIPCINILSPNSKRNNSCDIGFEKDMINGRLIVMSAIDNICRARQPSCAMHEYNAWL